MPIFVIERDFPGAEHLSAVDLRGIAGKAREAARDMGAKVQWIESFVTGERFYCVYVAADEQQLREHARRGGLPANRISEVKSVIGPVGAD
jgi:Protein of unknown function (DUF4242)